MQPEEGSGTSTPVGEAGEDLDFSDLKKKKKPSKKKAALDMEAFERELSSSKGKEEDEEEGEDGPSAYNDIDENEHGENPFAAGEEPSHDGDSQPWLGSDRDYTYPEVRLIFGTTGACVYT